MTPPVICATGQPFFVGSGLGLPGTSKHASCSFRIPSPSMSGTHPLKRLSADGTPGTSGHASSASQILSPSLSGGQPFFFGSGSFTPARSGHASSASRIPSPSLSCGGAGGLIGGGG